MNRPNFIVKVPSIPTRPRARKKLRKKASKNSSENFGKLRTIEEAKNMETRSSYYSLASKPSESRLRVLETYDEFLNLKDLDNIIWQKPGNDFNSYETEDSKSKIDINEGMHFLKQICADLQCPLNTLSSKKEFQMTSLFQTKHAKLSSYDIKTAIIAQRIVDTQEEVEKSRANSKTGFSKASLGRNSFNKRVNNGSVGTFNGLPCSSTFFNKSLSKTLSNLTSKNIYKRNKVQTNEYEVQVDLITKKELLPTHSCNTQTDFFNEIFTQPTKVQTKLIQTTQKTRTQLVQSSIVMCQDKYINTDSTFCPNQERHTQMYEHITENDLFCMEWIHKNLFKVPVNPNTVIVDERLRDSSELTCNGTSFMEQEMTWERQALCL